jgi:L-aspartate oxidase
MQQAFDFLVIGSGIAGLSYSLKVADRGRVAIVTKKSRAESNTNYAQGGIACVTSAEDSFQLHVQDTLRAGAGLCREDVVRVIVQEGPARIHELIEQGMRFSEREIAGGASGGRELDLGREGGHSKRRVLHAKDATGQEVERALLAAIEEHPNIEVFENHIGVNLITASKVAPGATDRCLGLYALSRETGEVRTFTAPVTLLATGGCGQVYLHTTNPGIATGDGVAMAWRAGATIANMEFIQFHPTCLYRPGATPFLISEALRGEGGRLVDREGRAIMEKVHPRKDLAPRDIVARAIDAEMKRTGAPCLYLDLTHKPADFIRDRFPMIHETCLRLGIDITREPIPVVPAAHYQCGGVATDLHGATAVPGLFAIGEVAHTGLHGANRLASNSLLEAIVMAHRTALRTRDHGLPPVPAPIPPWESGSLTNPDEMVVISHNWDEIRRLMWDYVGIVRTTRRLQRAATRLQNLWREINDFYWNFRLTSELVELRNLARVARLIVESAAARRESRGLHCTLDYPDPLPEFLHDTELRRN